MGPIGNTIVNNLVGDHDGREVSEGSTMTAWRDGFRQGLTQYGDTGFSLFHRKLFLKSMGYSEEALDRPIIGITNTASAYNSCHGNVGQLVEAAKRGIAMAGGLGFEFPVMSLHEAFAYPTSMYLRNLMAMEVEEMIRAQPMDAVVLIGGCDKTVPALLMGAISAGKPAILTVTGPMLTGHHRGERVGACTDCRRFWADFRAGAIGEEVIAEVNDELAPTVGTCMVMGTASTMAVCSEAMGMMLPGGASPPAVSAARLRHAEATGVRAVSLAKDGVRPTDVLSERSIWNAFRALMAIGGSTNALIHLTAIAGRLGISVDLDAVDRLGRETPVIVNLKPSGSLYMQELHAAGGVPAILRTLQDRFDLDAPTVAGSSHRTLLDSAEPTIDRSVVWPADAPLKPAGAIAILRGSLAPDGAVLKQSAAGGPLLTHEGRAVVFDGLDHMMSVIDSDDLDVTAEDVLVLRGIGPRGAPGMPEAGSIPIPRKLARQGVRDMVRISDGRMSGTAYGTIILHVAPEAAAGGPLSKLRTGDRIVIDVPNRRLEVVGVDLAAREPAFTTAYTVPARGYGALFDREITQANEGMDFATLKAARA